jgi:hypothetical protein
MSSTSPALATEPGPIAYRMPLNAKTESGSYCTVPRTLLARWPRNVCHSFAIDALLHVDDEQGQDEERPAGRQEAPGAVEPHQRTGEHQQGRSDDHTGLGACHSVNTPGLKAAFAPWPRVT